MNFKRPVFIFAPNELSARASAKLFVVAPAARKMRATEPEQDGVVASAMCIGHVCRISTVTSGRRPKSRWAHRV